MGSYLTHRSNMDRHRVKPRIKQLVRLEQGCDTRLRFAWQQLDPGCQILCADVLVRQGAIAQLLWRCCRVVPVVWRGRVDVVESFVPERQLGLHCDGVIDEV